MKIVTWNVHTPYLYSLLRIRHEIHCLINAPHAEYWKHWESEMRPQPDNFQELEYSNFKAEDYDVLILQAPEHLMSPLAHAKIPKIFIQHSPPDFPPPCHLLEILKNFCNPLPKMALVFVSEYVKRRWIVPQEVKATVIETAMPDEFYSWNGMVYRVLTVVNAFVERVQVTGYDLWTALTSDLPCKVMGLSPPIGEPASDFDDLRQKYADNRVYLNTTIAPGMGMREALMTGMPVVTRTEDIPFENEVEIFKSSNPKKMREYLELCLKDYDVAKRVGDSGRRRILQVFNINSFVQEWEQLLEEVKG